MIGSPTVTDKGVEVKTLLNPAVKPNSSILIESIAETVSRGNLFFRKLKSTRAAGKYKVVEVKHKGDTHSNEWSSSILGIV